MSDLYLDLKHRIPLVHEWTPIGTEQLVEAQKRTGLSNERLARKLLISTKTWTRWRDRGAIPTQEVSRVAPILGFEIVPLEPVQIDLADTRAAVVTVDLHESLAALVGHVSALVETVLRIEDALARIERGLPMPGRAPGEVDRA